MDLKALINLCFDYGVDITFSPDVNRERLVITMVSPYGDRKWRGYITFKEIYQTRDISVIAETSIKEALKQLGLLKEEK
jgi:hypothetical protein